MKTPAFIKNIGASIASAAAAIGARVEKYTARFESFKDSHPRFTRVFNVLTHPTTTRILGIVVAIAIAPLTGGFTLPLAVSISLSCAVAFSTTFFMGLQKYRLGKAKARLEAITGIVDAKSNVKAWELKNSALSEKLQELQKTHPELAQLDIPTKVEKQKTTTHLSQALTESLYYEGIVCLTVMTACFGAGGVVGFATSIASGLSGFIGQTRKRLSITGELYQTRDEGRHASSQAGLQGLSAGQERALLIQARALEAAMQDVQKTPGLSLTKAYDTQLKALQALPPRPSPPGFLGCLAGEINPFVQQHKPSQEAASHAPPPGTPPPPTKALKAGATPSPRHPTHTSTPRL